MEDKDEPIRRRKRKPNMVSRNYSLNRNQTSESNETEDKKRLVEIYLFISTLLISGLQITSAFASSPNYIANLNETVKNDVMNTIPNLNVVFVFFIVFILLYFINLTWHSKPQMYIAFIASLFFSFLIIMFLDLQSALIIKSQPSSNTLMFIWNIFVFVFSWAVLCVVSMLALIPIKNVKEIYSKIKTNTSSGFYSLLRYVFIAFLVTWLILIRSGLHTF